MWNFISKNIKHSVLNQSSDRFAAWFNPLNAALWRYPLKVELDTASQCIQVDDGARNIWFCRPPRVLRYAKGIDHFLDRLAQAYMLDQVGLSAGDWVVDCGANIGEVSMWLKLQQPELNIIAIEPETLEANCADRNIFGGTSGKVVRTALWNEETTLRFYSCGQTADSSVFEIPEYESVKEIPATTLDKLLDGVAPPRIRLLKLEAEGAEPEILEGCQRWLSRIDYIAADLGPERGLKQEQTATPVINRLLAHGFDLVDMRFDRVVCLFRNRQASS